MSKMMIGFNYDLYVNCTDSDGCSYGEEFDYYAAAKDYADNEVSFGCATSARVHDSAGCRLYTKNC